MSRIAFLGTGLMGAPMARHLAGHHALTVWNRTASKANALDDVAAIAPSASAAVRDAEFVIAMLIDGPATRACLDEAGVIAAAPAGALFINMASVEPECDRYLAGVAEQHGKRLIDAPVSGGVRGAEERSLSIFMGGAVEDVNRARAVLKLLGRPTHMGPVGAGQATKLANQLIVAITIGAVAEAFLLAQSAGCDIATVREALRGGFADSRILELHGERMVRGDFVPGGRSAAQLKDLRNALAVAAEASLDLPLSQSAGSSFGDLVDNQNGADLDHSAYFLWLKGIQGR